LAEGPSIDVANRRQVAAFFESDFNHVAIRLSADRPGFSRGGLMMSSVAVGCKPC
jgi:hypothetical protein